MKTYPMSLIIIDEIFDPIGNSRNHKQLPIVHWPYVGMERKYGVQIKWISPQEEKSMHYTIDMCCASMKEGKALWKITKDNFYIDNEKPEDHISLLALECAQPYYPFEFAATKEGRIDSILNTNKLQKRFVEAKPTLLQHYEGDIAIEYIEAIESSLHNAEQLKNIVTKDTWLSLFFAPITGEYDYETKTKEITIEFPFVGFEDPFLFKGSSKIVNRSEKTITVIFKGLLVLPAFIEEVPLTNGKIEISYDIDMHTYYIKNIMCEAAATTEQGEYKTTVNGYEKTVNKIIQIKEEKPKPEPVGWMAFFKKD
ncbi:MAG TPA: hypothetical protein VK705_01820 [Ferruginibacter sp.]|jgi:hypothetical protein|nr:hypothetical protein [Ferruginibacter sp.]